MYLAYTVNEKTLTVIKDGRCYTVSSSNPNFVKIKALLISGKHNEVPDLLDVRKSIEKMGQGDITIVGNTVKYQGRDIPNYQSQKLISMHRDGHKDIIPYKNFIKRLDANISFRAKEEFPRFMDSQEFMIDLEGFVYAFRGLQDNYYSVMGNTSTRVLKGKVNAQGQIFNGVGEEIEVERADVDDNCNRTCSYGVHVGHEEYARGWSRGKVVLVKFDPKDVVSVPTDCNGRKCRVCHYWVVSDYVPSEKPVEKAVYSETKEAPKTDAKNYNRGHYYTKFCSIIRKFQLTVKDYDVLWQYMKDGGFTKEDIIKELFEKFKIAHKIFRYTDAKNKKGEEPTIKQIQSAIKSRGLKQSEIEEIIEDYAELFV